MLQRVVCSNHLIGRKNIRKEELFMSIRKTLTRREFIKKAGTVGASVAIAGGLGSLASPARAQARDHILIGHPNPSTGPIASFGEASPWADDLAIEEINKQGGIFIKEANKKLPLKVKMVDTSSDPSKAADVASKLILNDKVDIMVALHTPDTVNPVTSMCERYEVPCVALDAPIDAWLTGGPYKWSFHSFWMVDDLIAVFSGLWDQTKTNKVVGAAWPNDPDGKVFSEKFTPQLTAKGYKVIDVGRFPYGMQDYSAFINTWKKEKVEIITGVMIPPDWATLWRQCHQQGFIPKAATMAKAILFPAAVGALGGNLPNGLTSEIWWSPNHPFKSSISGKTSKELCDAWTAKTKKEWTQPIGFKYAAYEIVADALKRAQTLEKNKVREALAATNLNTIVGPVKFNEKNYSRTPLVGGQWVKGKKWPWEIVITYNKEYPQIPTAGTTQPLKK
jgi:branched-chain amino acid transport system substrate-binding protein